MLGLRWLSSVKVRARSEAVGIDYASWWVAHMLLITCVPFSTMVLGRFAQFAPAVWLYAGNTALIGMIALRMMAMTSDVEPAPGEQERRWSLITLIACSLLAMGLSFASPRQALWAYALVLVPPIVWRAKPR